MSATGDRMIRPGIQAGFTLIEALVVVAIAALIGGLAFPRVETMMVGQEYRMAIASVSSGLRAARATALRKGRAVRFAPDEDGHGFSWSGSAPERLPASVKLDVQGVNAIDFFADGSSSGGAMALQSGTLETLLAVNRDTGRLLVRRS